MITRTHSLLTQNSLLLCLFTLDFETAPPLSCFSATEAAWGMFHEAKQHFLPRVLYIYLLPSTVCSLSSRHLSSASRPITTCTMVTAWTSTCPWPPTQATWAKWATRWPWALDLGAAWPTWALSRLDTHKSVSESCDTFVYEKCECLLPFANPFKLRCSQQSSKPAALKAQGTVLQHWSDSKTFDR